MSVEARWQLYSHTYIKHKRHKINHCEGTRMPRQKRSLLETLGKPLIELSKSIDFTGMQALKKLEIRVQYSSYR